MLKPQPATGLEARQDLAQRCASMTVDAEFAAVDRDFD
jgi:hypothetical protein